MIDRYTLPEMGKIWTLENKFQKWLDVEIAACEAMAELGYIPVEAAKAIREKAAFDVDRINEIEKVTNHDVIAFLTNVAENVGEESKYIHMGMTSSDVGDTALCLLMKEAGELLLPRLQILREKLVEKAKEYKYTPMIGRTHGIHAEPMTFGMKMLLWIAETDRNIERLKRAIENISVGKLSGAVGTYANIDPEVERRVCEKLGLKPAPIATQVIQRDRHAEYMATIAVIGCTLEKIATELRNLQRTDIREAEEYFAKGQKGSSAMPHKRNPITGERISGLARVLRGNALAAMENVALWHERDISHSSVERVIIPDSTILLDYMLHLTIKIVSNLLVYPDAMMENMNKTRGLIYSQRVLLALVEKGILRERAYELVQRNAMEVWRTKQNFLDLLLADEDVTALISPEELRSLFDYQWYLRYVDTIFARFGL
ncbi:adenylosuccinate lyase [Thermincola ferriacetica]|uniref:Adenylosuccinate lyase n=1 Tax=Thermincola ferriacetica TaxID=281456 RepID=A0A0L6W1U8_9FIRM|nr:adenylosuccinate lyase [Thermincola ferriacetica]KNZ69054.1 adenylosuccinate lyase [Thermincola ferriacetica]